MPANTKQSSSKTASLASETLRNPRASEIAKEMAGSVLSQSGTGKQTSAEMEAKAAKVLQSDKYSDDTKALAGSVLSQSSSDR